MLDYAVLRTVLGTVLLSRPKPRGGVVVVPDGGHKHACML